MAIAVVATRDDDATPADQPSSTVTVPPTTPPRALPNGSGSAPVTILPGTYFVDEVAGIRTPRIYATLGVGWSNWSDGWQINKRDDNRTYDEMVRDDNMTPEEAFDEGLQHDVGVMEFSHPIAVYSDACHWEDGNHPGPLDTVDGLVAALTEQLGWAEVTAPSDISVDGYVGKAFQRTAPADMSDCSTRNFKGGMRTGEPGASSDFRSWENPDGPAGWAGEYYEPGWIETLWVLDLDGTMVVISTGVWPEPSAGADPDFAADVLDSIRIDPLRALYGTPGRLAPGTYFVDEVDGTPTPRIFVTIGTGWTNFVDGSALDKHGPGELSPLTLESDIGFITFSRPDRVYLDACHLDDGFHPGPVTTLDGLVAALSEQDGWADVTPPTDISVDGYPGKTFQRTAPAVLSDCPNVVDGHMRISEADGGALRSYEPGQFETLMVLDIDGTVIVINANLWAGTSAADRAEFAAVLDSIRIDRP